MQAKKLIKASAVMSALLVAIGFGSAQGCGGSDDSSFPSGGADGGPGSGGDSGQGFVTPAGDGGGDHCVSGLCTQAVDCTGKPSDTTISGVVTDPAGKNPLYNVLVYIPNDPAKVPTYTDGPSCDLCGSAIPGGIASSAVTGIDGSFTLSKVPVGANIPVIVQVGKWRRTYTFANTVACQANAAPSNDVFRLPKNQGEGHIPKMAITTGGADTMECMFRRMGLDDAEFLAGTGRVGLYGGKGSGGSATTKYDGTHGGTNFPDSRAFWNDPAQVNAQDIIIYSCEGSANDGDKTANGIPNTIDFLNHGGKMFASHWHRGFFSKEPTLATIGTWSDETDPDDPSTGNVVTTFPKGLALSQWLVKVGASTTPGSLQIKAPRENVYSIVKPGTEWVYIDNGGADPKNHVPEFTTVDTPVGAADDKLCGKAAFSDLHVSSGGSGDANNGKAWPGECATGDLTAQEKALEFLFFDLSACVQNDSVAPPPPR
ncbi:MAG: carboxypeptidase regulatory-like domain-containing protein [Polyangiaceae bacterium]